ncbi:MAG: hypothetical protein EOP53_13235 [Sphingobacteriales bacterium]|nr:MAG: hypothetical protein EOP53_13235 [Sphingobacteriales bacterium]
MTELSQSQKDFIFYSALVGIGLGIGCFFQQLYIINGDFTIAILFSLSALTGIVAFSFLMLKRKEAGILLIIASALLFIRQAVIAWMLAKYGIFMFSLLQSVFIVYTIVIMIMVLLNGYPVLFNRLAAEKKADEDYWKNNMS